MIRQRNIDPRSGVGIVRMSAKFWDDYPIGDPGNIDYFCMGDCDRIEIIELGVAISELVGGTTPTLKASLYNVTGGDWNSTAKRSLLKTMTTAADTDANHYVDYFGEIVDITSLDQSNIQGAGWSTGGKFAKIQLDVDVTGTPTEWTAFAWALIRPFRIQDL